MRRAAAAGDETQPSGFDEVVDRLANRLEADNASMRCRNGRAYCMRKSTRSCRRKPIATSISCR